ncbi:MAG TPA: M14 family metallopeptidase [Saprospiraceae bacterium]|nr:M14 family metallopeptidase [Saprospiraceae bacterium]
MQYYFCWLSLFIMPFFTQAQAFETPFERNNNYSAAHHEAIAHYQKLQEAYPEQVQVRAQGLTDAGVPLHTIVLDKDGDFTPEQIKANNKVVIFVNNGIHPGEPCGVDASMMLIRDYLDGRLDREFLEHVSLVVIPLYNIGGSLNRGSYSRANQQGPEYYGFRGNAKNLDLNRDFIKADSRNARSMNRLFNYWKPHIFIDNHTSNGADYQYSITLIPTQHNKLQPILAKFMNQEMLPYLFDAMEERDWEMTPYVYARTTPDEGIAGFLDLPRYSSGYAALHNAISFMPETHMLKPFRNRVWSVYHFMDAMVQFAAANHQTIIDNKVKANQAVREQESFDLNWTLDQSQADTILFKGYEAKYKPSQISGQDRLYYDHAAPFEKRIPHFNYYQSSLSAKKPAAYVIPQAYREVIERLQWNNVEVKRLQKDTTIEVEYYYIENYETRRSPYEGHYLHYNVQVRRDTLRQTFRAGDALVRTNQVSNLYIMSVLEPQAADSYFAWNFFDGVLMQKEYFSGYVFEDTAYDYLQDHPELAQELERAKATDPELAKSARAQLNFIYERSPYYEPTYQRYPVGRILKE